MIIDFIRNHQLNIMLALASVCFTILLFLLMTNFLSKEKKRSLMIIAFSAGFLLLTDRYAYIFRGQTTTIAFIMARICKYLVFFNILNISYVFNEFLISVYKENNQKSRPPLIFNFIKIIIILGHLSLIASQFTNFYYSFDEFNNYHRESGYIVCYLFPIIATIIQYIVVAKYYKKTNNRLIIPIVLYFILPIITTIIQLFTPSVSLTNMTIAGVVIILYSFTIYDANMMSKEKEKTEADLRLANEIQQNELPNNFPKHDKFDLYGMMFPAKNVGGDYYDYFLLDENHLGFVIADVTGKGIPAALNMIKVKILLRSIIFKINDPAKVLSLLNDNFIDNNKLDMFVTVWFGIFEITTGKLKFVNAGHEDMILYNDKTGYYVFKTKHDIPIGVMKDYSYKNYEIKLSKGDRIFLHTDGVVDAVNRNNKQYGLDNLLKCLNKNKEKNVKDIIISVNSNLEKYSGGCEQFDDITMLCLEFKKPEEKSKKIHLKETFKADIKEIDHVYDYFNNTMVDVIGVQNVKKYYVVIDELFSNIAKYGYKGITDGRDEYISIDLSIDLDKKLIKIIFEDSGIPFNPLTTMDPITNKSAQERKIGGLGIFIVKKMMDKVSYEYKDEKNILTIEKKY